MGISVFRKKGLFQNFCKKVFDLAPLKPLQARTLRLLRRPQGRRLGRAPRRLGRRRRRGVAGRGVEGFGATEVLTTCNWRWWTPSFPMVWESRVWRGRRSFWTKVSSKRNERKAGWARQKTWGQTSIITEDMNINHKPWLYPPYPSFYLKFPNTGALNKKPTNQKQLYSNPQTQRTKTKTNGPKPTGPPNPKPNQTQRTKPQPPKAAFQVLQKLLLVYTSILELWQIQGIAVQRKSLGRLLPGVGGQNGFEEEMSSLDSGGWFFF